MQRGYCNCQLCAAGWSSWYTLKPTNQIEMLKELVANIKCWNVSKTVQVFPFYVHVWEYYIQYIYILYIIYTRIRNTGDALTFCRRLQHCVIPKMNKENISIFLKSKEKRYILILCMPTSMLTNCSCSKCTWDFNMSLRIGSNLHFYSTHYKHTLIFIVACMVYTVYRDNINHKTL